MLEMRVVRAFAVNYPEVVKSINKYYLKEMRPYMTQEVKDRTPVDNGLLKASIKGRIIGDRIVIGSPVEYGPPVEYGTRPHTITVENAKVLTNGKSFFGKKVEHPGTRAQPFMRPSIDENRRLLVGRWRSLFRKTFRALGKL